MWSSIGLAVVVVVDMAGGGWVDCMKGCWCSIEKIDEIAGGMTGGTVKLPKMGSRAMELDGDLVVGFTGIWRNEDRLADMSSNSSTSSHTRSCLSSEGEFSDWSEVSEISGSRVLVFLKCQRLQGLELGFLGWFEMVRDYSKDSLQKEKARPFVMLALGKGKHECKVQSKIQRKYVNSLSVTRLSVHLIVGQRFKKVQRIEEWE